jgi:ParB/RepB/Spo0J family partition protein
LSLVQLALSGETDKMKEYVRLVEEADVLLLDKNESEDEGTGKKKTKKTILQLASSIAKHGILQPIRVRPVKKGADAGLYDIVFGARRFMATLYLACKARDLDKFPLRALVVEDSEKQAQDIALAENITSDPLTKAEAIMTIRELSERGKSVETIAEIYSTNERTIKRRLNAAYAPPEILEKLSAGKIGITDVETIGQKIKAGQDPVRVVNKVLGRQSRRGSKVSGKPELQLLAPSERKSLGRRLAQEMFETGSYPDGTEVESSHRHFLSEFFGFEWKTVSQCTKERTAVAQEKEEKVKKPKRGRGRPPGSKNKPKAVA